jgi:hypothetical protein
MLRVINGGEMKKMNKSILLLCLYGLSALIILFGCGGSVGAPGSSDSAAETGVIIAAGVLPYYTDSGAVMTQVDVVSEDVCDAGPPAVYEFYSDHMANVSITANLFNPNIGFDPLPLYIERYTIDFYRNSDSTGAPPIESVDSGTFIQIVPPTRAVPAATTTTAYIYFVDMGRKAKYKSDIDSGRYTSWGNYYNNYTASVTFYGKNANGKAFTVGPTNVSFNMGHYLICP